MRHYFDLVLVEGNLEVPVMTRLLKDRSQPIIPGLILNKRGQGNFWIDAARMNRTAVSLRIAGLADSESATCPGELIRKKLKIPKAPMFTLNLAVRMVESWLIADVNLAKILKVPVEKWPRDPDKELHPKATLLRLVRQYAPYAFSRTFVVDAVSGLRPGPDYEPVLSDFILNRWKPEQAGECSHSLRRALKRLDEALGISG
jgi:hypothetical protein